MRRAGLPVNRRLPISRARRRWWSPATASADQFAQNVGIPEVLIPASVSDRDGDDPGYGPSIVAGTCQHAVMNCLSDGAEPAAKGSGLFTTTHWSVVLAAGQADGPEGREALEQLCRTYWYPLYVYVRRRGYGPEDAQDLTQQFFARFLERGSLNLADPARGRFRTFLLRCLQNSLTDDWKRAHRAKRGGGTVELPLDGVAAEARYAAELTDPMTPERAYEQRWALTLLDQVLERMREDYARAGKAGLFEALQDFLWGPEGSGSYAVLARDLAMTDGALRVAVHRLREQYRDRLRAEVAHTVSHPGEVDAELRYLIGVISGGTY